MCLSGRELLGGAVRASTFIGCDHRCVPIAVRIEYTLDPLTFHERVAYLVAPTEIDIPVAQSTAVSSVNDALNAAEKIGYPVILRSAFTLGGLGSGFANTPDELRDLSAKSLSLSPQVLIERSMKGWKELEYEVVRDAADVCPFSSLYPIVGLMHALEHYHLLQHGEF